MYSTTRVVPEERRVVIYARVSTEHEAQLSALENQKDWYKPILENNPQWQFVQMYVDEGITGTSTKKRSQFLQMMEDAKKQEFDLILTREVPRFARNTVDTLQYTRWLATLGVEVFFLNDNIRTFDEDGELRLTIMASLAQDESRKTSIRVKSGLKVSMEKGVFFGSGSILGYDKVGRDMVINPEQAQTVRMIFDWYLEGWGLRKIQLGLEEAGRLTATGKKHWHHSTIGEVLKNPFYCGTIVYRKEYVPNYLEQRKVTNYGEVEQIVVKGRHQPIVTEEEFARAQQIKEARQREQPYNPAGRRLGVRKPVNVWTKLMVCKCGYHFNRKIWRRLENKIQYGYQCYASVRIGTIQSRAKRGLSTEGICDTPMIVEWKMQMMARWVFQNCLENTGEILDLSMSMLEKHIDDREDKVDNSALIQQKKSKIQKLNKKLDNLIEMRIDGEITKEIFKSKQEDIQRQIETLQAELEELDVDVPEDSGCDISATERLALLRRALEQLVDFDAYADDEIPEQVVDAFVTKIVASKDSFEWYLRFSADDPPVELQVEGKRQNDALVSSLGEPQHMLRLTKLGNCGYSKLLEFTVNKKDAEDYLYAADLTKHRILKWDNLQVSIYI